MLAAKGSEAAKEYLEEIKESQFIKRGSHAAF